MNEYHPDPDVDCPMCSRTMDASGLCEHDDPLCVAKCCTLYHGSEAA